MKSKKLLAMFMVGAMMIGAMTTGVNVYADSSPNTTTVTLTKAASAEYTMTIPSSTTFNTDGTATALTDGLKVEGSNLADGSKVKVALSNSDNWKLKSSTTSDTIAFGVYSDSGCTTSVTSGGVEFTKTEVETPGGTTKQLYVKPDATELANATAATYSTGIVFTASLEEETSVTAADALTDGAQFNLKIATGTDYLSFTYKKETAGFTLVELKENGTDITTECGMMANLNVSGPTINLNYMFYTFTLDANNNIYTIANATFTSFSVKPAGATSFTDVSITTVD